MTAWITLSWNAVPKLALLRGMALYGGLGGAVALWTVLPWWTVQLLIVIVAWPYRYGISRCGEGVVVQWLLWHAAIAGDGILSAEVVPDPRRCVLWRRPVLVVKLREGRQFYGFGHEESLRAARRVIMAEHEPPSASAQCPSGARRGKAVGQVLAVVGWSAIVAGVLVFWLSKLFV